MLFGPKSLLNRTTAFSEEDEMEAGLIRLPSSTLAPEPEIVFHLMNMLIPESRGQPAMLGDSICLPAIGRAEGEPTCGRGGGLTPWPARIRFEPVCSLQEAVFFVVRILVGFMPRAVANKIIHVCSLLLLASHSLHTVHV